MKYFVVLVSSLFCLVLGDPLPMPQPEARMKLYYYPTSTEQNEIIYNSTESLLNSNLKPATKTILVLDGFRSHLHNAMNKETRELFSGRTDLNVIVVDWSAYSGHRIRTDNDEQYAALYAHVLTIRIPEMVPLLADFIEFISENSNIPYEDITLVSFSLGCHVAGQTGRALLSKYNKTVGRIVAEDTPHQFSVVEIPFRLRRGDADVVETYITDRVGWGNSNHPVGDVSIFVNGGANQPCIPGVPPPPGGFPCDSHVFAYRLYNYLDSNATIKACPCRGAACLCQKCSFECGEDGISVGPHIPKTARGTYHLKTGYLDWST